MTNQGFSSPDFIFSQKCSSWWRFSRSRKREILKWFFFLWFSISLESAHIYKY